MTVRFERGGPPLVEEIGQAARAEELLAGVLRLDDPVGVEIEPIARLEADGVLLVFGMCDADGEPSRLEDPRGVPAGMWTRAGCPAEMYRNSRLSRSRMP